MLVSNDAVAGDGEAQGWHVFGFGWRGVVSCLVGPGGRAGVGSIGRDGYYIPCFNSNKGELTAPGLILSNSKPQDRPGPDLKEF